MWKLKKLQLRTQSAQSCSCLHQIGQPSQLIRCKPTWQSGSCHDCKPFPPTFTKDPLVYQRLLKQTLMILNVCVKSSIFSNLFAFHRSFTARKSDELCSSNKWIEVYCFLKAIYYVRIALCLTISFSMKSKNFYVLRYIDCIKTIGFQLKYHDFIQQGTRFNSYKNLSF